jgi:hypothetical protein
VVLTCINAATSIIAEKETQINTTLRKKGLWMAAPLVVSVAPYLLKPGVPRTRASLVLFAWYWHFKILPPRTPPLGIS